MLNGRFTVDSEHTFTILGLVALICLINNALIGVEVLRR